MGAENFFVTFWAKIPKNDCFPELRLGSNNARVKLRAGKPTLQKFEWKLYIQLIYYVTLGRRLKVVKVSKANYFT